MLLEVKDLNTFYGASHVLQNISVTVNQGELVGLLGRNGMGKSTTLKSIMGLVRPRTGSIRFKGKEILGHAPHHVARVGIGYVPEERAIFPTLSVLDNLLLGIKAGKAAKVESHSKWDLERIYQHFPILKTRTASKGVHLSGGEQQMLTIGRALLTNPELLILDEATEGLAPRIAREIWAIVRSVRESGVATVIVDKNFKAVNAITDRNIILVKGRVAYEGPAADLAARPEIRQAHLGL